MDAFQFQADGPGALCTDEYRLERVAAEGHLAAGDRQRHDVVLAYRDLRLGLKATKSLTAARPFYLCPAGTRCTAFGATCVRKTHRGIDAPRQKGTPSRRASQNPPGTSRLSATASRARARPTGT